MKHLPHWILIVGIAALLRLPTLGSEALWYDETFTAWISQLSLNDLWRAVAGDVHPPLWYIIEWIVVRFLGTSEFALRLPSALFGIGACLMIWSVAKSLCFDRTTALLAGVLTAAVPSSIYYSQEARMYTLLSLFVLIAVQAAIQRKWLPMVAACVGALYSQNLAVFFVAACVGVVLWQERRTPVKALLSTLAIGAAWAPWAGVMFNQARSVGQAFWLQPLTIGGVLEPLMIMTMGWRIPEPLIMYSYASALGATAIGVIVARRWLLTRNGVIILAAAFGAPALVSAISATWRSIYLPRAFLPSALLLMLFWAYALQHLGRPNRRVLAATLLPFLAVGVTAHYFGQLRFDWRAWLAPVHENWQAEDVIYHAALSTAITFTYYLPGKPYLLRAYSSDLNQALTDETRAAFGFNEGKFEDLARGAKRVWLLFYTNPMSHIDELKFLDWARAGNAVLVKRKANAFSEVSIYLWRGK